MSLLRCEVINLCRAICLLIKGANRVRWIEVIIIPSSISILYSLYCMGEDAQESRVYVLSLIRTIKHFILVSLSVPDSRHYYYSYYYYYCIKYTAEFLSREGMQF